MEGGLRVVPGGGELIEQLEAAIARVKSGQLVGVAIIGISSDGWTGWGGGVIDGTPYGWSRMIASHADAGREMLATPIKDWP